MTENPPRDLLLSMIEGENDIYICGPVLMEVLRGIRYELELKRVRRQLLNVPFIDRVDVQTWQLSADIFRACRANGLTIRNSIDCLIAAIAIDHDLTLLHNDQDFERIRLGFGHLRTVRFE